MRRLLATAGAVALIAAGCGSDDDESPAVKAPSTTPPAATSDERPEQPARPTGRGGYGY